VKGKAPPKGQAPVSELTEEEKQVPKELVKNTLFGDIIETIINLNFEAEK